MKNTLFYSIIAIIVILIVATLIWQTSSPKEDKIKIGLMAPFTGNAAQFGSMIQNGLDLALSELPAETRNKIEIIKEDDQCSSKEAFAAAQKLINIDNLKYVIGPMCNEAVLSTESLFEDNKVIALTIGLPSNQIAKMGQYHFSFSPEIEYLMKTMAQKVKVDNITKVAIIHINAPFEIENYNHFKKYFEQNSGTILADELIDRATPDFKTPIVKIKASNPEAIIIMAHTTELVNILKQLKESGLDNLPKYGIHAAEAPVIIAPENKGLAEGLIYPYPADKTEIDSAKQYAEKYKAKYNFDVDPYSANTYDSVNILVKAIEKCDMNSDCVLKELSTIKDYPGANGLLTVDDRGVGNYKEIMLKVVKDAKFQKLQ